MIIYRRQTFQYLDKKKPLEASGEAANYKLYRIWPPKKALGTIMPKTNLPQHF